MFKDKKFARRLALVLCLSLVVGILPIGVLNAPVPVNAVPDDNMVVNGDFEASDTELLNWKQTSGKAAYVVTDKGVDGSNALNLVGKGQEVESDKFAVTSGAELTITFQYVQESDATKGLTAYALWYNEDGSWYDPNGIGDLNQYNDWCTSFGVTMSNEWQESVKVLTVPTGAAKVAIRFYAASSVGTESNIYIDDVTATEVAPTEPPKDAVFAENFDSNNSDAKLSAAGWTANENFSASNHNIGVYNTAYEGCALWMQQTSSAWAKTPAIAAVPGATYTVNVLTNGPESAASMKLIFVDAAGNVLAESEEAIGTGAAWAEETVTAVAPENTANVYVYFDRGAKDCGIDNLAVYEELPAEAPTEETTEATEPSTEASEPADLPIYSNDFDGEYTTTAWVNSSNGRNYTNELPKDWTAFQYEQITVSLIKGQWGAKDGKMLFLQVNKDKWTRSDAIPAVAGATYTITYDEMDYIAGADNNYGGYAAAIFVDADGKELAVIKNEIKKDTAAQVWSEASFEAVAPEGAVALHIEFGIKNAVGSPEFGVDNLKVYMTEGAAPEVTEPSTEATEPSTEATEPSEPAGDLVFSDKFEEHNLYEYTNSAGNPATNRIPEGWTSYDPANIRVACNKNYFDVYEGYNLFFQEAKGDKWIKSPAFDVAAGNTYTANFMDIKMPGTVGTGAYAAIVFVDANGAVVSTKTAVAGLANEWTANSVTATAPAGAVAAYIEFGLKSASGNPEFAVDNLEVYLTEGTAPEVTEPSEEPSEPATDPSTEPSEPAEDGLIINGGFENGVENWGSSGFMSSLIGDKVSGNASMKFADESDSAASYAGQKVPVVPGKTYVLSAWIKVLSGKGGYMGLYNLGDANAAVGFTNDAGWTYYTLEVTIPAGYTETQVEIGSHKSQIVTFLVDDVQLVDKESIDPDATLPTAPSEEPTVPSEPAEPTEAPIFTETFEEFYKPEGKPTTRIPVGWTPSVESAAIGTAGYDKYDGTENLCIQDKPNKDIKSPLIEVIPGYEYTATYVEKKYQPAVSATGGYVKIVFVDAEGTILKEYSQVAGQSAEWTNKILVSKAPAGATHMYVEFGLKDVTGGDPTYSVDNLAVYAYEAEVGGAEPTIPTEPIPTEPEGTNVMFGDKFETLADASTGNGGPLGWISSDDVNGAYSAAISVGTFGVENDGNFLCLQTPGQWSIKSTKFAAKAGYEYEVKFLARKLVDNANYTGALTVFFLDAYGNVTGEVTETVGKTYGAWAEESVKAVAPNGTVAAYLEFSLDNADRKTKGDYGIDDLEVIKSDEPVFIPEDPTEPSNPSNPDGGNTGTGDSVVLLPVFGVMAAVVALAVLVIKKRRFF